MSTFIYTSCIHTVYNEFKQPNRQHSEFPFFQAHLRHKTPKNQKKISPDLTTAPSQRRQGPPLARGGVAAALSDRLGREVRGPRRRVQREGPVTWRHRAGGGGENVYRI